MKIHKPTLVNSSLGKSPSIVLINPKFARNLGAAVRACSAFNISQLWFTGNRLKLDPTGKERLPREERMKGYSSVDVMQCDRPFDGFSSDTIPVAVELKPGAVQLQDFEHKSNMIYVFGPEDGSLERVHLQHCHHIVVIPTKHCLNLATAMTTILWDRQLKLHQSGEQPILSQDELLINDRVTLRLLSDEDDESSIG